MSRGSNGRQKSRDCEFYRIFVSKYSFVMKSFMAALVGAAVVVSCASRSNNAESGVRRAPAAEPVRYGYNVKAVYPHLKSSYTQGLQFADGVLWEGTGEWGESVLQRVDLESGEAEVLVRLPRNEFGEGITVLGDKIYQLTWTNNTVHIYDLNGKLLKNVRYPGEGWGLTSDGERLYMSNGSSQIYRIAPDTFKREGSFTVTLRARAVSQRAGVDRRPYLGQCLHHRLCCYHQPRIGRRGGNREFLGLAEGRGYGY